MGASVAGHVIPGLFFLIHGLIWSLFSFWIHLTTPGKPSNVPNKSKSRQTRTSHSLSYGHFKREMELNRKSYIPQPFCRNIPMEPIIKVLLPLVGMLLELFIIEKEGKAQFKPILGSDSMRIHHVTMYCGFFLSGLIDLITLFVKVPRNTTKLFLTLAFAIEGLLFWFHRDENDDSPILSAAHLLLFLPIMICALFSGLRMLSTVNLMINAGLSYGILLQGSWFIQVGVVLHRANVWDFASYNQVMLLVSIFSWHSMSIFCFLFVLFIIMSAAIKSSSVCHRSSRARRHWLPSLLPTVATNGNSEEGEQLIKIEEKPPLIAETAT
uniref:Transmembrane protein 45B n=2 Tax=Amphimedon queenslandica TaxID=400682 RepID=A0A1X7VTU2_AMPQE